MPQKKPAKLYRHELDGWFSRFAANLKEVPGGNPMTRLMEADAEINPYFVALGLYWFRAPRKTSADRGRRLAQTALDRLRKLPSRLQDSADDIRWILKTKFPPPWGRQLQELTAKVSSIGSSKDFEALAGACERGARMTEALLSVLKNQASGKRKTRNAYATILWLHMRPEKGRQKIGTILSLLVECADGAFYKPQEILAVETFELTRQRYQQRWPEDYR